MLFDLGTIHGKEETELRSSAISESGGSHFEIFTQYENIERLNLELVPGTHIHFVSMVEWSMHEMLHYVLQKTGPAEVHIATWSLSEIASRYFMELISGKLITALHGVFDYRTENRHPEAFNMAKMQMNRMRMFPCHAKAAVIKNEAWDISISGSANFTNNKRIETGVISVNTGAGEFHRNWINQVIDKGIFFEE